MPFFRSKCKINGKKFKKKLTKSKKEYNIMDIGSNLTEKKFP